MYGELIHLYITYTCKHDQTKITNKTHCSIYYFKSFKNIIWKDFKIKEKKWDYKTEWKKTEMRWKGSLPNF